MTVMSQVLWYAELQPIFGHNDAKHVMKAIPRGLRASSRVTSLFGFHVAFSPLVAGGCPRHSLVGRDMMSDAEAAHFLNARHLGFQNGFEDVGAHLLQFLAVTRSVCLC